MSHFDSTSATADRLAALERNVQKLHTQNRKLRLGLASAVTVTCCVFALGMAAVDTQNASALVVTQRLTLVDANGNALLELGAFEEGNGLVVYGPNGAKSLLMGVGNKSKAPGLLMLDSAGTPRIGVGLQGEVPSVVLSDAKGLKRVGIGVGSETRYGFVAYDGSQVERVGMGVGPTGPLCVLLDGQGKPRIGMSQDAKGGFALSKIDESGVESPIE